MSATERWAAELAAWAVPEEILAAAPESPWGFPTGLFRVEPGAPADSPSHRRAREALPEGGSVLDIGAGGGAGSLGLVPAAAHVVAVDEGAAMLAQFAAAADERGVQHAEVEGSWPDIAEQVEARDVVVCHHVLYNVPDVQPFVDALNAHARRRVVVELTQAHPLVMLNPLWRHFHDLDRPDGPTGDDALAVLREAGIGARVERFTQPSRWGADRDGYVAFVRRRLCLPPERDPEIAARLPEPGDRQLVTLWWDP